MPTIDELRAANAGFEEQMQSWRQQRYANGENPLDWGAFRQHLLGSGAADPGEAAPDEFYRWDESLMGGEPDERANQATPPA
jgi:hypothetical protein